MTSSRVRIRVNRHWVYDSRIHGYGVYRRRVIDRRVRDNRVTIRHAPVAIRVHTRRSNFLVAISEVDHHAPVGKDYRPEIRKHGRSIADHARRRRRRRNGRDARPPVGGYNHQAARRLRLQPGGTQPNEHDRPHDSAEECHRRNPPVRAWRARCQIRLSQDAAGVLETRAINCPNSNLPSNGRRRPSTTYCRFRLSNRGLERQPSATMRPMREKPLFDCGTKNPTDDQEGARRSRVESSKALPRNMLGRH